MMPLQDFCHRSKFILPLTLILAGCGGSRPHGTGLAAVVEAPRRPFAETFEMSPVRVEHYGVVEAGRGIGTIPALIHLILNELKLSATFVAQTKHGDFKGRTTHISSIRQHRSPTSEEVAFSGTGSIDSGTGIFAHTRANDLQVRGVLLEDSARRTRLIVHINGTLIR
jgi:hypothetical protein